MRCCRRSSRSRWPALAVFDRCSVEKARIGVLPGTGELFVRDSQVLLRGRGLAGVDFRIATDDLAFVQYLVGGGDEIDDRSRTAAKELHLDRDLRYWGTLRRHADPEIRAAAIGRLGSLLRRELPKFAMETDDPAVLPQPLRNGFADEVWSGRFLEWLDVAGPSLVWDADAGCYRRR